ncbi:MAG: aldose epimerase family protein [Pseudomonadota bacterium]
MDIITLSNAHLTLRILTRGAALIGVRLNGLQRNLVLAFADPADHLNIPIYAGAIVGPVANRVAAGRVQIDGQSYQMARNEQARTALHAGPEGLHAYEWKRAQQTDSAVHLIAHMPHGAAGLPGEREISATYCLKDSGFSLEITAKTDRATPINIAAHPYWHLDDTPTIAMHKLAVKAARYTPTDRYNIPTGATASASGTPYDFQSSRPVPLTPDIDFNACLADAPHVDPTSAARLIGSDGLCLDLATNAPGLQVYNGAHMPTLPSVREGGKDLWPYAGIALEPQHWPDAPNHPHFPQITLRPGDNYRQRSEYRFSFAHMP